jgi:hypothetical protein
VGGHKPFSGIQLTLGRTGAQLCEEVLPKRTANFLCPCGTGYSISVNLIYDIVILCGVIVIVCKVPTLSYIALALIAMYELAIVPINSQLGTFHLVGRHAGGRPIEI